MRDASQCTVFFCGCLCYNNTDGVEAVSETVVAVSDAASFSPSSRDESASQTVATVSEAVPAAVPCGGAS